MRRGSSSEYRRAMLHAISVRNIRACALRVFPYVISTPPLSPLKVNAALHVEAAEASICRCQDRRNTRRAPY